MFRGETLSDAGVEFAQALYYSGLTRFWSFVPINAEDNVEALFSRRQGESTCVEKLNALQDERVKEWCGYECFDDAGFLMDHSFVVFELHYLRNGGAYRKDYTCFERKYCTTTCLVGTLLIRPMERIR